MAPITLEDRVIYTVACAVGVPRDRIELRDNLRGNLDMTSFDLLSLSLTMEEEFGRELTDSDLENISTVEDLVEWVRKGGERDG